MNIDDYCIDTKHKQRLKYLIQEDGTNMEDIERMSLFYIIAGNEKLYLNREFLYDFKQHCRKDFMGMKFGVFSSGMKSLIRLGFNLYNGYRDKQMTPLELFWNLDSKNRQVAQNAIRLRFMD